MTIRTNFITSSAEANSSFVINGLACKNASLADTQADMTQAVCRYASTLAYVKLQILAERSRKKHELGKLVTRGEYLPDLRLLAKALIEKL